MIRNSLLIAGLVVTTATAPALPEHWTNPVPKVEIQKTSVNAEKATRNSKKTRQNSKEKLASKSDCLEKKQATSDKTKQYIDMGEFRITWYCPCEICSGEYGHDTSTGARATEGRTVAVDPDVIPYGTHVLIDGKEYVAEDCGGAVKGDHIDIFVENHEETERNGVTHKEVKIVRYKTWKKREFKSTESTTSGRML